jgi:transcriptional regulator with XRE-family HTH domain
MAMAGKGRGDGPHWVDTYVGSRIRTERKRLGLSQSAVAQAVGVTFQQLQKYEKGSNRVSASMLVELASVLSINPAQLLPENATPIEPPQRPNGSLDRLGDAVKAAGQAYREVRRELG